MIAIRASALDLLEECAYSQRAKRDAGREAPSDYAEEGVLVGQYLEAVAVAIAASTDEPPCPLPWLEDALPAYRREIVQTMGCSGGIVTQVPMIFGLMGPAARGDGVLITHERERVILDVRMMQAAGMMASIRGTADILLCRGSDRIVLDIKAGPRQAYRCGRPRVSLQLGAYALGLQATHVGWVFPRLLAEGDLRGFEIDPITDELRGLWHERMLAIARSVAEVEAGRRGPAPGEWCSRCYAQLGCPAARDRVAMALTDPEPHTVGRAELGRLVELLPHVRRYAEQVERAARAAVQAGGPIALPSGERWGMSTQVCEVLGDAVRVREYLALADPELATDAVELKTSKAAVERAVKARAPRGSGAARWREVQDSLRWAGLLTQSTRERWGVLE